jgi:hypothetical protein
MTRYYYLNLAALMILINSYAAYWAWMGLSYWSFLPVLLLLFAIMTLYTQSQPALNKQSELDAKLKEADEAHKQLIATIKKQTAANADQLAK